MTLRVRPGFITFLGFWLALSCVGGLVFPTWLMVGSADDYTINGAPATRDEFIAFLKPLLPWFASMAILSGVTSWAILSERAIGRPLAVALIIAFAAGSGLVPAPGALPFSAIWPIALAAGAVVGLPLLWYFYRKRNVLEYYRDLMKGTSAARPNEEL